MIIVDIETSGINFEKCGIWQIGAIEYENPQNQFLEEAKIDSEDRVINEGEKTVQEVTGKTEQDLRNKEKQSQKQLIENFFKWCEKITVKDLICHNPQFDLVFISAKARKYNLNIPFNHRAFDLHSIAQLKYFQKNKKFLIANNKSEMGLTNILKFCGLEDKRKFHNGLEDAKLTAECFNRILKGKVLFDEFKQFQVPDYLK